MAIFKLDPGKFRHQIQQLHAGGDKFQAAQMLFTLGVDRSSGSGSSSGGEQWSGVNELDQFRLPLDASLVAIDEEMKATSRRQKAVIADLRQSLVDFEHIDDNERQAYLKDLDDLDAKYEYSTSSQMEAIATAFTAMVTGPAGLGATAKNKSGSSGKGGSGKGSSGKGSSTKGDSSSKSPSGSSKKGGEG